MFKVGFHSDQSHIFGGFESPKFNLLQKRLCKKTHPPILKSALEMQSILEELKQQVYN
jgi:hypothetical protein